MKRQEPYITVAHGISGYFAVLMRQAPDGLWEPMEAGFGRYTEKEGAIKEAKHWADCDKLKLLIDSD